MDKEKMSLPGFSLKHPTMISMFSLAIIIFGILGASRLSLCLMPPSVKPGLTIITEYAGVSPLKIENIITKPIEDAVSTIEGIQNIISSSEEGKSRVNIEFDVETDMDIAALKVREKIYLIRGNFPRTVQEPLVIRYDPSNKPILILSLSGGNIRELRTYAENVLKRKIESIKGISEVQISGGLKKEIWVVLDRDKMYSKKFQTEDVIAEINGSNFNLPGGKIKVFGLEVSVQTRGRYRSLSEIRDARIRRVKKIRTERINTNKITEIAKVINHYRDRDSIYRENDQEKVSIYIQKAGNANTIKIAEEVLHLIKGVKKFKIEASYNQAKFIKKSLNRVKGAGLIGGIIAMAVLLIFLKDIKNTIAIAISIPLSILLTLFLMFISGISLNIMSMSGLALGIGMLVDNSIVVLENIHKNNAFNKQDIEKSVNEVFAAIIASTLTTVAVFLPIIFTSIEVKSLYGGFALTVGYSIFSSLLISVTLVPILVEKLNKKGADKTYPAIARKIRSVKLVNKLLNIITFVKIRKYYVKMLLGVIRKKKRTLIIVALLAIITVIVFPRLKKEYMDPFDTGEIICMIELPSGTNLFATDRNVRKVEKMLKEKDYIKKTSTKVEKWHATVYITLVSPDKRSKDQDEVMADLKKTFSNFRESFVHFSENTADIGNKELDIQIIGDDIKKIKHYARVFTKKIKPLYGIRDVVLNFKMGRPEIVINIKKNKASLSGLSVLEIAQNIRSGIFGPVATKYLERGREIDLRVRFKKEFRDEINDLKHIQIRNAAGDFVRLEEIADFKKLKGETKIFRKNQKRYVSITVKLGRIDMGRAVDAISEELKKIRLPRDYRYEFGQNFEKMKKNQKEMALSVFISFVLIYMILASQFESFKYPLLIVFSVPFAFIGIIISFYLLNKSLNVSVYIGLVMLAGIVVNNAIVLVDSFNQRRERITGLLVPVVHVARQRLKPILMTTLTTVLGLLPLLFESGEGSNLWKPMGLTVILGLLFSTLLTLLLIPLAYLYFSGVTKRIKHEKK